MSKDYEALPASSAAWVQIAMRRPMLRRLARNPSFFRHPLSRWRYRRVWPRLLVDVSYDPGFEWLMINAKYIKFTSMAQAQ